MKFACLKTTILPPPSVDLLFVTSRDRNVTTKPTRRYENLPRILNKMAKIPRQNSFYHFRSDYNSDGNRTSPVPHPAECCCWPFQDLEGLLLARIVQNCGFKHFHSHFSIAESPPDASHPFFGLFLSVISSLPSSGFLPSSLSLPCHALYRYTVFTFTNP